MSVPPDDSEQTKPDDRKPVVELRHDAGLTAGHTLGLRPGTFRLGPRRSSEGGLVTGAPEAVSFDLIIDQEGNTTLKAGREPVAVEGVVVDRPVQVKDGDVIQLTTDQFVLRSLTPKPRRRSNTVVTPRTVAEPRLPSMAGWLWLAVAIALFGLILGFARPSFFGLILIGLGGIVGILIIRSRRHDRARREHTTQLLNARSLFFHEIVDSRKSAAESLRFEANTPATVARRAAEPRQSPGSRLHATVASGDRSWDPPVVCHRDPGWDHQEVVDELSFLPAIPFTIDLDAGPIALVGQRRATLAMARHIATTALIASPKDSGVSVSTAVPADWRWLPLAMTPTLYILDLVDGPREARTLVVAPSTEALGDTTVFTHVVEVHEDGRASIRQPDGLGGEGFIPHGITEKQAAQIHRLVIGPETIIDLRNEQAVVDLLQTDHDVLDADRLLVTGPDRSRTESVLATAALRQAARYPDRSIFILDRGDRALIRLAQLKACNRYVAIDQIDNVNFMMGELEKIEREPLDHRVLFLAPGLWEATAFYRNSGRADLADRIDRVVDQMEVVPLAASSKSLDHVPRSSFLVWVNTDGPDLAEVHVNTSDDIDALDSHIIDLTTLPGVDMTASVARLTTSFDEETPT